MSLKLWERNKIFVKIKLKNPNERIKTDSRRYFLETKKQFRKQIPELLVKGLIRKNNNPYSSSTFMVINKAE